mmetsp:Transcript_96080/g.151968  ORF Transcript_96080/g.151968 Transcript_96080/m.151968 type:complete len:212 (+) Transcript_96080:1264-1899(+)
MGKSAIEKCLELGRSESCADSISSPSDAPPTPALSLSRGSVPSSNFFFNTRSRNDVAWLATDLPASSSSSSSQKKPSPPSSSKKVDPNVAASFFSESVGLRAKGRPLPIGLPRAAPVGGSSESWSSSELLSSSPAFPPGLPTGARVITSLSRGKRFKSLKSPSPLSLRPLPKKPNSSSLSILPKPRPLPRAPRPSAMTPPRRAADGLALSG